MARGGQEIVERYNQSDAANIGSAFEISIRGLLETITWLTGFAGRIVWDTSKLNSQPRHKLDVSPAQERFDFRSQTSFEDGLWKAIEWHQGHPGNLSVIRK